jgi:hypothetical protein
MSPASSLAAAVARTIDAQAIDPDGAALEMELSYRLRRAGFRATRPRMLLLEALHRSGTQGMPLTAVEQKLADDGNSVSHSSMLNSLRELAYKRLIAKAPGQPEWLKVADVVWLDAEHAKLG